MVEADVGTVKEETNDAEGISDTGGDLSEEYWAIDEELKNNGGRKNKRWHYV